MHSNDKEDWENFGDEVEGELCGHLLPERKIIIVTGYYFI